MNNNPFKSYRQRRSGFSLGERECVPQAGKGVQGLCSWWGEGAKPLRKAFMRIIENEEYLWYPSGTTIFQKALEKPKCGGKRFIKFYMYPADSRKVASTEPLRAADFGIGESQVRLIRSSRFLAQSFRTHLESVFP